MNINILTDAEAVSFNRLIDAAERIVICCHRGPDGDAMGSSLALAEYLRARGKDPAVCIPDMFPDFLQWMPGTDRVVRYDKKHEMVEQAFAAADLVFCLDFNRADRLDVMGEALTASPAAKVLVDHHPDPDIDTVLAISRPDMSSTCELLFRILWQTGGFPMLSEKAAAAIYCGMMTDTGGFTYNSTSPEIFFIISQLLTKHINKDKIYRNVYNNYSEWRLRLVGYVMYQKLNVIADRRAAYFTLTRKELHRFHYVKGDIEGVVNIPLQIKGLRLSILLREDTERDNLIWVSLRSVDDFSCTRLAEKYFNGGGHLNASGGRLYCSMPQAEAVVRKAIYDDNA